MSILQEITERLAQLPHKKPLVHHITNYVTVNDCANMTLAIGASPVMADDREEAAEMAGFASALVLNMGTLNARTIESMLLAGKQASAAGIPVIFDPVGVGATRLRTETAEKIIRQVRPAVIRGNMSEIKMIAGLATAIRGVDSVASEEDGRQVAQQLAKELNCVVAITGRQDIVASPERLCVIDNGHAKLAQVTGTGCMATSLIGCCCGAGDVFTGTVAGLAVMGIAGEIAAESLQAGEGIGTFRVRLFDAVSLLTPDELQAKAKISS